MIDQNILASLEKYGQQHVLQFWDELTSDQRNQLTEQLKSLDWTLINDYQSELESTSGETSTAPGTISPPMHLVRAAKSPDDFERQNESRKIGEQALREGRVGAMLLAGGQGTRLGFPHPKGMFPIGPVSGKSLFELFAEQVIALSDRYGHSVPYLIMTSEGTHEETIAFFEKHSYFGLKKENVIFFGQGFAPSLDSQSGKLLLADKGTISMSPDGHGGLLAALLNAHLFEELSRRNIDYIFLHQVDNPLVKICDPVFLGVHLQHNAEVSIKVVKKTDPAEKVGLAVDLDGRTAIIEYSDLPNQLANQREPDGELRFWAGSTAIHLFNRKFLEGIATSAKSLPWHRARKKIPFVDAQGRSIQPQVENGVKFERFLFDTLPLAKTALVVETIRDDEFAPLKNKSGDFSAEYVQQHILQATANWLQKNGYSVPPGSVIEISPRYLIAPEELNRHETKLTDLVPNNPVYVSP